MRDEQQRARERLERRLERLARLEVEVVRRLVEDEEVRARRDDDREREPRRSPPESTVTGFSCSSQPEKRNLPRRFCACGRCSPVIVCTHCSTEPRSSSSSSCCEKYAGSTPWPSRTRPSSASRRSRIVSSSVVLPEPFGPTSPTCSPRSIANDASSSSCLSPALRSRPSASTTVRPLRGGFRNSKPSERVRLGEQRDLAARLRPLLLQARDVRQLRLRLLGLVLLVAEALDEAVEPRDVDLDPVGRLLGVLRALRLLEPPRVPRPGEERRPPGDELERRVRHRLEEPAVVRDEDDPGVERAELVLEPLEARDVEVVRRLVEEQQVGVAAERARERGARQLAAGERRRAAGRGRRPRSRGRG